MDEQGNVNVSNFAGRVPGVGGFADIAANAKTLVFTTTLTCGNLVTKVEGGKLIIVQEGSIMKFLGTPFRGKLMRIESRQSLACGCWRFRQSEFALAQPVEVQADYR